MIQTETNLVVADNTGAKSVRVFHLFGGSHRKSSGVGDIVLCSVKDSIPNGKVKTGDIVKILDIDSDSLGSLCVSYNSKGEIVIVNYESDYYIESYYTLSTEYDEMTDIMLNNIISMLNNEF